MVYSCALWGSDEHGPTGDLDREPLPSELDSAQTRKLQHVIEKARIKPGDRILEFGSGWGALAIAAALAVPDCEVDSITLSIEQKTLAEGRARVLGLHDRVRFHLMDYRNLPPEWEKQFDVFVSIEMIEHVGTQYYNTYFGIIDWALKTDGARVVVSASTFPEHRYSQYQ
jgi:cyclopropane-fatty-acyl-phospholipid synthase